MNNQAPGRDLDSVQLAAYLEGGPTDIPIEQRQRSVDAEDGKIKLLHYGGYEHFERTDEYAGDLAGPSRLIYRWVHRTKIAE